MSQSQMYEEWARQRKQPLVGCHCHLFELNSVIMYFAFPGRRFILGQRDRQTDSSVKMSFQILSCLQKLYTLHKNTAFVLYLISSFQLETSAQLLCCPSIVLNKLTHFSSAKTEQLNDGVYDWLVCFQSSHFVNCISIGRTQCQQPGK